MANNVYGIDLGATNSRIAQLNDDGVPELIPNREGTNYTPSVVFFNGNYIDVGEVAKANTVLEPENTVSFVRNLMGKTDCAYTYKDRDYKNRDITPEEISSYILKKVAKDAEYLTGQKVKDVVITVPAYFGAAEREATANAGRLAGLNVLNIISEPVAAAIGYGITNQTDEKNILIYDLGGSTFDVTVLKVKSVNVEIICADGNHDLGGKDWDRYIERYLEEQFREVCGFDGELDPADLQDLALKAEKAKRELTERPSTKIPMVFSGYRARVELTREKFEGLTAELLDLTITITDNVIETAKNKGINIDQILLVGGSTYMPQVAETLRSKYDVELSFFGPVEPEEAVAKGAAIYATIYDTSGYFIDYQAISSEETGYKETNDPPKKDSKLGMQMHDSYRCILMKPLIRELIDLRENALRMSARIADYIADHDTMILNVFKKYDVTVIKSSFGDEYNPVCHCIFNTVNTDNPSLHNKIANSISNGYMYDGKVISPEYVNVYLLEGVDDSAKKTETISLNTIAPVRHSNKYVYGIDLGTTNTCIARIDEHGKPEVINNKEGSNTTPSVVLFDGDKVIAGEVAKSNTVIEPENTISFVKTLMGKADVAITNAITNNGRDITPAEVSSYILKKVAQDAEYLTNEEVKKVIITVPAYFGAAERAATELAGELAGLNVLSIINEPLAAAIYYGITDQEEEKNILIYDLGGGSFDVTILTIKPGWIKEVCKEGDHDLGGIHWDRCIQDYLEENFREVTGFNGELEPADLQDLVLEAEKAKKELSWRDSIKITMRISGFKARVELTREKFEELTAELLDLTITITDSAIEKANKKGVTVDQILLVGGSTYMPQVSRILKSKYGIDPLISEPDEAVAKGAAIYATDVCIKRTG